MNTTLSHALLDTTGTTHAIGVEAARITVDGTPCQINVKDTQVDLISSDPKRGVITVSPASLWHAFAGSDPTPEAAGLCLSEALARHGALQEIAERSQRVRLLLDEIDRHIEQHRTLPLPSYRFSRFVHQLLETLDGTEEQTLAVARILKQPPETIAAWGAQIGKSVSQALPGPLVNQDQETPAPEEQPDAEPVVIAPSTEAATEHNARPLALAPPDKTATENQADSAGNGRRGKRGFLWTEEHERLLEEAVQASQQPSTNAKIKDISSRFDWPFHVVDYRMRQLQKKSQQEPPAPGEPASFEQTQTEAQPITSPLTVDVSPGPARLSRSAEPASLEQAQAEEVQPVTSPLTVDVSRSLARLSPGPFLWDVKINGYVQRWQLDAPYGKFPFASPGTSFSYRDEVYVLQQVWHSIIAVTPAVHAQRPAVMELVEV